MYYYTKKELWEDLAMVVTVGVLPQLILISSLVFYIRDASRAFITIFLIGFLLFAAHEILEDIKYKVAVFTIPKITYFEWEEVSL